MTGSTKSYSAIPFERNKNFVGRRNTLETVCNTILSTKSQGNKLNAITGLDGIGKTELALEVAYMVRDEKEEECSVFWVRAHTRSSFESDYSAIARCLDVHGEENLIERVNYKLKRRIGKWLMVIDGVDECEDIFKSKDQIYDIPHSERGSILLTAGKSDILYYLGAREPIILTALDKSEAFELLKQGLVVGSNGHIDEDDENPHTVELLGLLAGLPLAINLASTYMSRNRTTVQGYLEKWKSNDHKMIDLLCQSTLHSKRAFAATWLITFSKIKDSKPEYLECLREIACYSLKNIPYRLLKENAQGDVDEVIETLLNYSFITKPTPDADSIDAHPLVQKAMFIWLKEKGLMEKAVTDTVEKLANLPFPTLQNLQEWEKELEHAETALGHKEDLASSHTDDTPSGHKDDNVCKKPIWRLLYMVGQANFLLGKHEKAKTFHEKALKLEVLQFPTPLSRAPLLRYQGKYEEAEEEYRHAISQNEGVLGEGHPSITSMQRNLACTLLIQGKYGEATARYQEALDAEKRMLGESHPSTITTMDSLAFALKSEGNHAEAITQYKKILQLKKATLGEEHPSTIGTMENLAIMYQREKQYVEAEALHLEIKTLKLKILGENHPSTRASAELLTLVQEHNQIHMTSPLLEVAEAEGVNAGSVLT